MYKEILKVFLTLLYFLFLVSWLESKENVHSEYHAVQKGCLVFLKKNIKLTLAVLLNVHTSLLLLKINELVRWWRVSREVDMYQEWLVLLICSFAKEHGNHSECCGTGCSQECFPPSWGGRVLCDGLAFDLPHYLPASEGIGFCRLRLVMPLESNTGGREQC